MIGGCTYAAGLGLGMLMFGDRNYHETYTIKEYLLLQDALRNYQWKRLHVEGVGIGPSAKQIKEQI